MLPICLSFIDAAYQLNNLFHNLLVDEVVTNGVISELMRQLKRLNDTVNERANTVDSRLQKLEGKTIFFSILRFIYQSTEFEL